MSAFSSYLAGHWLALSLLGLASLLFGWTVFRQRSASFSFSRLAFPVVLAALGIGGLGFLSANAALILWVAAACFLGAMLIVVFFTTSWWAPLGCVAGVVLCVGLSGWLLNDVASLIAAGWRFLFSLQILKPAWLVLLAMLPVVVYFTFRSLTGLGPFRRWTSLTLRCLVLVLVILAIAETHGRKTDDHLTVLFVWDRSLSMPRDVRDGKDVHQQRIFHLINQAVAHRPVASGEDMVGVVVFGREPRLDLPAGRVKRLDYKKIFSQVDTTYSNLADGLRLARASFPQGSARRIVLISDGRENLGKALDEALAAKKDGVQIDVIPIEAESQATNEVIVEYVDAPAVVDANATIPVRIRLRNLGNETVEGTLVLFKRGIDLETLPAKDDDGKEDKAKDDKADKTPDKAGAWPRRIPVKLPPGIKDVHELAPGLKKNEAYVFEAEFLPVIDLPGGGTIPSPRLAGDRPQNNRASAGVVARGERMVLLIEQEEGQHRTLVNRLSRAKGSLKVVAVPAKRLPKDRETFAFILSKFDGVIIANLPADHDFLSEEQQKIIRAAVFDQGIGLVMIGGPQSYGAGGWQGTEIEKALPVTSDLKAFNIESRSGLVLIMHASEIAQGNAWQRKIAQMAVERLGPADMIGMIYWDHGGGGHRWHVPFQEVGGNKGRILGLINGLDPGDMPEVDSAFLMAHKELTKKEFALGTKHIILISDGDHWHAGKLALGALRADSITCTTVCVTSHGDQERSRMQDVAFVTGGRFYDVRDNSQLPSIYLKETRLVSKAFLHEDKFKPLFRPGEELGPAEGITDAELSPFYGFIRTTRRPSPLVSVPIETPKIGEYSFPLLAFWTYGMGKSVAFTSDARSLVKGLEAADDVPFWDKDFAGTGTYTRFWEQAVQWSLRSEASNFLDLRTHVEEGKVKVIVHAHDQEKQALTNVKFKIGLTNPTLKGADSKRPELQFDQVSPGVYETEFDAEEIGNFIITVEGTWKDAKGRVNKDRVSGAVTIPYSPEFLPGPAKTDLLEQIARATGGERYSDEPRALEELARSGMLFRAAPLSHRATQPLWAWLALVAGMCLLLEIAVRRIAIEPAVAWAWAAGVWERWRGRGAAEASTAVFLERLHSRKAKVSEDIEKQKGARFEGTTAGPLPETPASTATGATPSPAKKPPPRVAPEKEEEPADFATRLMRAKKKAMEDRDKKRE